MDITLSSTLPVSAHMRTSSYFFFYTVFILTITCPSHFIRSFPSLNGIFGVQFFSSLLSTRLFLDPLISAILPHSPFKRRETRWWSGNLLLSLSLGRIFFYYPTKVFWKATVRAAAKRGLSGWWRRRRMKIGICNCTKINVSCVGTQVKT